MDIVVSGKHVDVTEPIRAYAMGKVDRFPKFFDRVTEIEVLLDKHDNHSFEVEMIVKAERTDPFVATASNDDLYAAIDDTTSKIERQLHDHKEKLRNRKHIKH